MSAVHTESLLNEHAFYVHYQHTCRYQGIQLDYTACMSLSMHAKITYAHILLSCLRALLHNNHNKQNGFQLMMS